MKPLLKVAEGTLPNVGIFLSGSGSNAEMLLKTVRALPKPVMNIAVLVTDAPLTSRARELGRMFNVPVAELDIKQFYADRGETRVSIATEAGQRIREEWTNELRRLIAPYKLDFAVFAGFVPLTNISSDFPCLNVHPGDLTYLKDGKRLLVGLHTIPIENAIVEGLDYMRSSVIIVETYSGSGKEMDNGLLLGISPKVRIEFAGHSRAELAGCIPLRPAKRPKGGYGDIMESVASDNQGLLKENGDWIVLPQVVIQFASGNYAVDDDGTLLFRENGSFTRIRTVEFSNRGVSQILREE